MDDASNPYSPGAGVRPAAVVGREQELAAFDTAVARLERGRPVQSIVLHGLRGVGKTVLLNELATRARTLGWIVGQIEADLAGADISFRTRVARALADGLRTVSPTARAKKLLEAARDTLERFSVTATLSASGPTVSVGLGQRGGSGALNVDLADVLTDMDTAAQALGVGVALFVDELQHVPTTDLAALCQAIHSANQRIQHVIVVGAGLPSLPGVLADAVSYAERLFNYFAVGPLTTAAASDALTQPAEQEGVRWGSTAAQLVLAAAAGYPYFLQQFGQSTWSVALGPHVITKDDATNGVRLGRAQLDNGFFRARWDRATPAERDYMATMAAADDGHSSTGDLARRVGKTNQQLGPVRANLIAKGLVWAPEHGMVAFTVPGMASFIKRVSR